MKTNVSIVDLESYLRPILSGLTTSPSPSVGFEPLGAEADCPGCRPEDIPQTTDQLGELISYTYDLTVRRAAEFNIPVVGSVSGGFDRRVVVLEWTRYKEVAGAKGITCRYGYVIRFCLTISKWSAQTKVSLPYLSAQAELGNLEASWLMQVRGLVGPKIDAVVLPPQELKVETFVIARQSLIAVIGATSDATTRFIPGIMLARIDPTNPEVAYWRAAVQTFSIDGVRRGWNRSRALSRLGSSSPGDADLIGEVYSQLGVKDDETPGKGAQEQATNLLRGIRVTK